MEQIKYCGENPCKDCPFTSTSIPGWLGGNLLEDIVRYYQVDALFPCHRTLPESTSMDEVRFDIMAGKVKICRGYLEMMKVSCKVPRNSWLAGIVNKIVPGDSAMMLHEFVEHHTVTSLK